jgi:hypothetical protein
MLRSLLGARSWISWGRDTLVVILSAYYKTLEFWIEYAYRALLIGPKYVFSEVVVRYLSIAQRAPVLERELWFVLYVRPCGRTTLKFGLRWSMTWWRGAAFCYLRHVDHWVLTGGIDCFSIATPDHVDSSGFVVRISLRANPDDRVVIDGVPISGHAGPSIEFIVAGCLTVIWHVVTEFLRPWWNSKPMVIVCHSSCS